MPAELTRVKSTIANAVLEFFETIPIGGQFHASDLHRYVVDRHGIAPSSADRVLRELRRDRELHYGVMNRAQSLYRRLDIPAPPDATDDQRQLTVRDIE